MKIEFSLSRIFRLATFPERGFSGIVFPAFVSFSKPEARLGKRNLISTQGILLIDSSDVLVLVAYVLHFMATKTQYTLASDVNAQTQSKLQLFLLNSDSIAMHLVDFMEIRVEFSFDFSLKN